MRCRKKKGPDPCRKLVTEQIVKNTFQKQTSENLSKNLLECPILVN